MAQPESIYPGALFTNPSPAGKRVIDFIDKKIAEGLDRNALEKAIFDRYEDKTVWWFASAYLEWKMTQSSLENLPESGASDALREFMDDLDLEEVFDSPKGYLPPVKMGDYRVYCCVNTSRETSGIPGMTEIICLERDQYIHVELSAEKLSARRDNLRLEVSLKGSDLVEENEIFAEDFAALQEGERLRFPPFFLPDIIDQDYTLDDGVDHLTLSLRRNDVLIGQHLIPVQGDWPVKETESVHVSDEDTAEEQLAQLDMFPGWGNFKRRMHQMCSRRRIDGLRLEAGLGAGVPSLHTAVIGHPGTGKSSCVTLMASIYKALGYLDTEETYVTRLSKLSSSVVNGEFEAVESAVAKAQGGTLVFENAHELYRTEPKNHDTEGMIIRALTDALQNKDKYPRWMLVLVGEPEGMEALFAANPDLCRHFNKPIYMEDFLPDELFWMIDACCRGRRLKLSPEARRKLEMYILHKYNHRGPDFQNAWLVQRLFDEEIIPAMYGRLDSLESPSQEQLSLVLPGDVPALASNQGDAMAELDELIGLEKIKTKVKDYLNAVRLAGRRMEMGLPTNMPRLHMAFLGNPGTGKTTVAEIIGKVFASWGILSGGRVIRTEKSQMVGQYIGETEFKMKALLERARGNILFIDEAYQLVEGGEKDYGRVVMNSLLTELGKENPDMVVILAGYTAPMKRLLESNEGIESRFPNVFNFEDYTTDELLGIAKLMISRQGFILTDGAEANMRRIIEEESEKPSPRFGNGRFVSNLLQNEVLAMLGGRTAALKNPSREDLCTILPEDVVIGKSQKDIVFDDKAIDAALARLDALVGLDNVKTAIHNFVRSARYLHSIGEPYVGKGLLSWRFIGKSGTGKSTVAEIMAAILKGMRLISNSHITEIKGERIFNVSESDCDAVLSEAVKKACNGLIFIDTDDPKFSQSPQVYGRSIEQIRLKVKELTVETGGECALILAELEAPNGDVAEQLSEGGVHEFDHTLVFKDFTSDELFGILCHCLEKFSVSFTPAAEKHMRGYLDSLSSSIGVNARTMKLMSRTIYQQVILRESGLSRRPKVHQVNISDVATFKWNGRKGKIGF